MTQEWEEHRAQGISGTPGPEEPEADVAEQRRPLDYADEPEDAEAQSSGGVREADDADVQEQHRIVRPDEGYPE